MTQFNLFNNTQASLLFPLKIEAFTEAEWNNPQLIINYDFAATSFGNILIANTEKGICYLVFFDDDAQAFNEFKSSFPNAQLHKQANDIQQKALQFFLKEITPLNLHLKGSPFQLKVWEKLLQIPLGGHTTYGAIAEEIADKNAARAVGTAIGKNPVAFLIPCHRVVQAGGKLSNYRWGKERKAALLAWEANSC